MPITRSWVLFESIFDKDSEGGSNKDLDQNLRQSDQCMKSHREKGGS